MDFHIAETFTDSPANMTGKEKSAAKTTAMA
jgi:hypothetical protein